jgi:hypothetical protein
LPPTPFLAPLQEGGILAPTAGAGFMKLEVLSEVFGRSGGGGET